MVRIVDARRRGRRTLLTLTATVALVGAAVTPAQAHGGHGHPAPGPTRVASGLDNPRQLSFGAAGDIYVAEAGRGGTSPCKTGPEGDEVCFGTTGAVTRVHRGHQSRVLKGLPSLGAKDGSAAIGPSDVEFLGGRYLAVLIGLGANPAERDDLPGRRTEDGHAPAGAHRLLPDVHHRGPRCLRSVGQSPPRPRQQPQLDDPGRVQVRGDRRRRQRPALGQAVAAPRRPSPSSRTSWPTPRRSSACPPGPRSRPRRYRRPWCGDPTAPTTSASSPGSPSSPAWRTSTGSCPAMHPLCGHRG